MSVIKNIKQRTTNNSFNTYPIGMNAEFITIPAGTANLYENNVNADEGMSILKNYIDEQISIAKVNFFVNYTDIDGQVYNLRVYNDNTANGQELRNTLNNLPQNISNISIDQLYAPNFIYANTLFFNNRNISSINTIDFLNVKATYNMFEKCTNLSIINKLNFGFNIENTSSMFSYCYNLTNIPNFDTRNVIDMSYMFYYCYNLTNIPNLNTINVVNMQHMFDSCFDLTTIPLFNTSNVTDMSRMFDSCSKLINIPLFNTSNVINMSRMFETCSSLTNIPNFNTRNVTNMSYMFATCRNLTNISNLNTINVVNMQRMFLGCFNLKSTIDFDTSNVVNMEGAFYYCNNLVNINRLNLNKTTEISSMIAYCNNLSNASILNIANSLPHYNNIINANKYNTLDYIGFSNNQMNIIANNPTVLNSVENKGWTVQKVKYELAYTYSNNPDTWLNYSLETTSISNNAQALRNAFGNKDIDTANIIKLNVINMPGVVNGRNLFANNGSNYNFSKMTNVEHLDMQDLQDASYLFYNDRNLTNIFNINCNNIINTVSMFNNCGNLTIVSNFNTSKVTNMGDMFIYCNNLIATPNFNTSKVTNMSYMFYECEKLTTVPNFDTSNVTGMRSMFWTCNGLINTPNFNISKVTDMYSMFAYCHNLITVSNFNTSNVITMFRTFDGCNNLVNVPNFNTPNVTNMKNIFLDCDSLSNQSIDNIAYSLPLYENIINGNPSVNQYIGLSNAQINSMSTNAKQAAENKGWMVLPQIRIDYTYTNGVNGTNKIYNIDTMNGQQIRNSIKNVFSNLSVYEPGFYNLIVTDIVMTSTNCNISNLNGALGEGGPNVKNISLSDLDTSKTIDMSEMFYYFVGLINISNFDTSNVINMSNMFSGCQNLTNIPNLNTSKVTDMRDMFSGCYNLINIPNFNTSNVINMSSMFTRCENLTNISSYLDMSKVTNLYGTFMYCNNLSLNSLQNIILSIPDRDQITGTTTTTNLQYIGLSATQINNLPTYYKQIAADKGWYVEGYEPKYTEMLIGTANALGDITFEDTETYPMRLVYDDMFGDYYLENTNQGKASTTSSATLTVSEDLLNVFDPMFRFLVYYSSETDYDSTKIYKNDELIYEYSDYDGTTSYLDTTFWLEVQAGDVLKFKYEKDSSGDRGLDGCKIYISGWKNNKSYEVRYSTVDAPTTYITKFIPKEDN